MSLESTLGNVWNDLTVLPGEIYTWLKTFFSTTIPAEVTTLAPLAEQAIVTLGSDFVADAGNLSAFATSAGQVLLATAKSAETAALQVAGSSLLTAVSGAIANAQAAALPNATSPASTAATLASPAT